MSLPVSIGEGENVSEHRNQSFTRLVVHAGRKIHQKLPDHRNAIIGLILVCLGFAFEIKPNGHYTFENIKFYCLYLASAIYVASLLRPKYGSLTALLFAVFIISASSVFGLLYNMYSGWEVSQRNTFKAISSIELNRVLLVALPILLMPKQIADKAMKWMPWIAPVNCVAVIVQASIGSPLMGTMGNISMHLSVSVVLYGFLLPQIRKQIIRSTLLGVLIAALILGKSTVPFLMAGIMIGVQCWHSRYRLAAVIAGPLVVLAGSFIDIQGAMNSNGRFEKWSMFMTHWYKHFDIMTGTGLGTFRKWGPTIQFSNLDLSAFQPGQKIGAWTMMHSDWLQLLFETGIIGLSLGLAVISQAVYRSRHRPVILSALLSLAALAAVNWPSQHPASFVLCLLVFREAMTLTRPMGQNTI